MEDEECVCGRNPFDPTDQCYCPYIPKQKIRVITPLPEGERILEEDEKAIMGDEVCLSAWLAGMELLTPG